MGKKKSDKKDKKGIDIFKNDLVPQQEIISGDEKNDLLERLNISVRQLPRMKESDPAAKALGARRGDVIKVTRRSKVAGEYIHYRVVVP